MSILESIRTYFCTCPYLKDGKFNADYLGSRPTEYTVDAVPAGEVVQTYVDGSSVRRFEFVFASCEAYGSSVLKNLENAGFYEQVSGWIQQQSRAGNLPQLSGGRVAQRLETRTGGYLFDGAEDAARYQIQCALTYFQPALGEA